MKVMNEWMKSDETGKVRNSHQHTHIRYRREDVGSGGMRGAAAAARLQNAAENDFFFGIPTIILEYGSQSVVGERTCLGNHNEPLDLCLFRMRGCS